MKQYFATLSYRETHENHRFKRTEDQEPEESEAGAKGNRRKQESPWKQGVSKSNVVI